MRQTTQGDRREFHAQLPNLGIVDTRDRPPESHTTLGGGTARRRTGSRRAEQFVVHAGEVDKVGVVGEAIAAEIASRVEQFVVEAGEEDEV